MKWLERMAVALVALCVLAYATIYALSSSLLKRTYSLPLRTVTLATKSLPATGIAGGT